MFTATDNPDSGDFHGAVPWPDQQAGSVTSTNLIVSTGILADPFLRCSIGIDGTLSPGFVKSLGDRVADIKGLPSRGGG